MKYKTLGELLAFINEHIEECEREELRIAIVRQDGHDGVCYKTPLRTINTIYTVSLINSLVVNVEQKESDIYDNCLLIKVLV